MPLVAVPLSLVLESVGSFADSEPRSLVVLPLPHVRLDHVEVSDVILADEAGVAIRVHRYRRHARLKRPVARLADVADGAADGTTCHLHPVRRVLDVARALLLPQLQTLKDRPSKSCTRLPVGGRLRSLLKRKYEVLVLRGRQDEAPAFLVQLPVPVLDDIVRLFFAAKGGQGLPPGLLLVMGGKAIGYALPHSVAVSDASKPLALVDACSKAFEM